MEGARWSQDEYLSLLRSGGGTAYGMVERYFRYYGYPTPELRGDDVGEPPAGGGGGGAGGAATLGMFLPEGYENASAASRAAAARAAASRDPVNRELLATRRAEWIRGVVEKKVLH